MITRIEDIPITESHNPPIKILGGTGKYYLVFTSTWLECTKQVFELATTDIIRAKWKKPYRAVEKSQEYYTTEIKSNSSDSLYKVTFDKYWSCECKAYQFRRTCSHIESAKQLRANGKRD